MVLLAVGALLPIALLGWFAYRAAARSVRDLVEANNMATGTITAELVRRDLEQCVGLARAWATLPGVIEAVKGHDEESVRARLRPAVESYPSVDRAFVTDPAGRLWSDFPRAPESLGRSFAHRDWYHGLSRGWQPYVSEVYLRQAEPQRMVVAIAVPVRDEQQEVIGALVVQYHLNQITLWLQRLRVGGRGYVVVLDHTGTVAAHPGLDLSHTEHNEYLELVPVQQALQGELRASEYIDPVSHREMVATFVPTKVARQRWVVIAGQPVAEAYGPLLQLRVQIGVAVCILVLAGLAAVLGLEQISERNRRLSRQLAEQNRQLQRSNEDLAQFASVASHDLQEPLRAVASFLQLLAQRYRGRLDAEADEFIGFAVDGAKRMQNLINDLLAYSRVGTRSKPFEPVDCERALDTALANLQVALEESGAVVTHHPLPSAWGDGVQLTQLFQNLIGNASKFHRSEPPRIEVAARRQGAEWLFSVRDNGIGIEPQYFDRIFQIFQRLHSRDQYPGTGIGLAICKRIVERHGGRIGVESEPGRGSIFWFTLPAVTTAGT